MKYADRFTAIATAQMHARCTFLLSLPQPKIQIPRNVDSTKNAARADSGHDAEREVDEEELAEELRQLEPLLVARAHPRGLHDRDQGSEADRQRDEDEVIDGGDAKLPPCQVQRIHCGGSRVVLRVR